MTSRRTSPPARRPGRAGTGRRASVLLAAATLGALGALGAGGGFAAPPASAAEPRAVTAPAARCVPGTGPVSGSRSLGRFGRAPDGPSYTNEQLRRIERRLAARLEQLGLTPTSTDTAGAPVVGAVLRIPVYVHVIGGKESGGPLDERIDRQLRILNDAYAGGQSPSNSATRFQFYLASLDRVRNQEWRTAAIGSADDLQMRQALHRGGPDALNLYVMKPTAPGAGTVLGWSTRPQDARQNPDRDGVVVHQETLPGGGFNEYNLGDTAVHEVGHWLGLLHTFEGGCQGPGDLIDDTPAQADPSSACVEAKDTCPLQPGFDPVHNFMDYSVDACMNQFTPQQVARMQDMWLAYRTP